VRAPPEVEEVYRGVTAPMRKAVAEDATVGEMPKVCLRARGGAHVVVPGAE